MKKFLSFPLLLLAVFLLTAATPPVKTKFPTPPTEGTEVTLRELLSISPREFAEKTGSKLSLKDKIAFSMMQKQLKKDKTLNLDSKVSLEKAAANSGAGFSIVGFLAGLLLGLIGVALCYIFSDDAAVRRSSWYGLGVILILVVVLYAAAAGSM